MAERSSAGRFLAGVTIVALLAGCRSAATPTPLPATPTPVVPSSPATSPSPTVTAPTPTMPTPSPAVAPTPTLALTPGTWAPAGTLAESYSVIGVLVAAGDGRALAAAWLSCPDYTIPYHIEIGDPLTGQWRLAGGPTQPDIGAAIVGLSDGRVLFAGGADELADDESGFGWRSWRTTRLYDPATGKWSSSGPLRTGRLADAVALPGGRALIVGGRASWSAGQPERSLSGAELWDPKTGRWSAAGQLSSARSGPALVALADGRVLAVGGLRRWADGSSASSATDVFDPRTRRWTKAGRLPDPLHPLALVPQPDGGALAIHVESYEEVPPEEEVAQDEEPSPSPDSTDAVFRFNPATGTWSSAPELVSLVRTGPAMTVLPDGRLFVVGDAATRLYDPATGVTTSMATPFSPGGRPVLLADGSVLVAAWAGTHEDEEGNCVDEPGELWRFIPG